MGVVASAQAAEPGWTATEIGPPGFWPLAVNDEGVVVGYVGSYPNYYAVAWADGTTTALDTPDNTVRSSAAEINDAGDVVGSVTLQLETGMRTEAALWSVDGGYTPLGFLDNGTLSSAYDITDLGRVVGVAARPQLGYRGVVWNGDDIDVLPVPPDPPCPPGGCGGLQTASSADAINNQGDIVGTISYPYQPTKAVIWAPDAAPVFLPPLAGRSAAAQDVNDSGVIVGNSYGGAAYASNAVVWVDGELIDLGPGWATGINDDGLIVGVMTDTAGIRHAYAWEDLTGSPLPTPEGDVESLAGGVNASGQIIGASKSPSGTWRGVMWTRSADAIPPLITVPADITRDATSPAGVVVDFTVGATDEDPTNPTVSCTPPSGSVFAIGETTVSCEATDAAANTGTASFRITVKGAGAQLADLRSAVEGLGPGKSLADKVQAAQAAYSARDESRTCEILNAFVNQVNAQSGKSIAQTSASGLIVDALRIRAVLGC
jgi:probable HAF family extracellular repeat protein